MEGATQIMFTWQLMTLLIVTALLHLAGFVTPGWIYMKVDDVSRKSGLWYGVVCHGDNCTTVSVGALDPYFDFPESKTLSQVLPMYRGLATTALACSVIAILTDIAHRRTTNKLWSMWSVGISIITVFVSGILGIIAPVHYAHTIQSAVDVITPPGLDSPFVVWYSALFTLLGGLLALVTYSIIAYKIAMARDRK